jgi:hypothetical protein
MAAEPENQNVGKGAKHSFLDLFSAAGVRLIAGLLAIAVGLASLVTIALAAIFSISDAASIASISSGAFGVIGSIVGAYFGVKVGTDTTTRALDSTDESLKIAQNAIAGQRFESAKAQAFAGHVDPEKMSAAIAHAIALATVGEVRPPTNVSPPEVTGRYVEGGTLSASGGGWAANPPPSLVYQWQSYDADTGEWVDIAGATAESYTIDPSVFGKRLRVVVTATNDAGSASAVSPSMGEGTGSFRF